MVAKSNKPSAVILTRFLAKNQYDELEASLHQLETSIQREDNSPLLHELVQVAREICLACDHLENEASWHHWAAEEAERREDALKQSLRTVFDIIGNSDLALSRVATIQAQNGNGLWNRLQHFLRPDGIKTLHPENNTYSVAAYCLGDFQVYLHGQPVENWLNRKGKSILKYLLLHRAKPVAKEVLMECFWPESDQELARNNLNVAIYSLRQTLRKTDPDLSYILFREDCYLLNPDLNTWIDFEVFEDHFKKGQEYETAGDQEQAVREYITAESLYQGELFEADRYEDWPNLKRRSMQDSYLYLLDRLSQHFIETRNYTTCAALCRKMLVVDSCREDAHRRLMQCYIQQGHYYLALRQYHICVEAHKKELDTLPSPETTALYEQVRSMLVP